MGGGPNIPTGGSDRPSGAARDARPAPGRRSITHGPAWPLSAGPLMRRLAAMLEAGERKRTPPPPRERELTVEERRAEILRMMRELGYASPARREGPEGAA